MKRIRITESDLTRIVKRVIKESFMGERNYDYIMEILAKEGLYPGYEWFYEFEGTIFYDENMTDEEYAESVYDFITQYDEEDEYDEDEPIDKDEPYDSIGGYSVNDLDRAFKNLRK